MGGRRGGLEAKTVKGGDKHGLLQKCLYLSGYKDTSDGSSTTMAFLASSMIAIEGIKLTKGETNMAEGGDEYGV
jgi:hypothetical protein